MKIDWKRKLTSRKLWMAVAGFITGVILLFSAGATDQTVTGCVMSFGSIVAYIVGEGLTDAANIGTKTAQDATKEDEQSGDAENEENATE